MPTRIEDGAVEFTSTILVDGVSSLVGDMTVTGAIKKLVGTSANDARMGGLIYVDSASHANSGTGVTDLGSFDVIANTLANPNESLSFKAWGQIPNTADTKLLKVLFGTDTWTLINSTLGIAVNWIVRGEIIRTGAATQDVMLELILGAGTQNATITIATATRTLSSLNTLKLTGQGGASSQIIQEGFKVYWEPANT